MRRILVLGPPGSGKSTLARRIGETHGLPVFHLDQAYWRPGWVRVPEADFARAVDDFVSRPAWVIDGNYIETIRPRLSGADTVIYLDMPRSVAICRILRRIASHWRRARPDAAPGCPEQLDRAFLTFAWTWNARFRERMLGLIAGFEGRRIVLKGREARAPSLTSARLTPSRPPS